MTIIERIDQDFKEAMKTKDEILLSVLRMMKSALKNRQIELMHDLKEEETNTVLKTMIKQYRDALADFVSANRQDLADRQQKEIDIISKFLPAAMPMEELERVVQEAVTAAQATDVGRAMGVAMKAVNGRADGGDVRRIVERLLSR
ncbi:MAG: GatB/YqeY domain-containing protein [Patescibacteria group bacterium]